MSLNRFASLYWCEADWKVTGPYTIEIIEPLAVEAPLDAMPYCCLLDTVQFFEHGSHREVARGRHHDIGGRNGLLLLLNDGVWYEVGGGTCTVREGRWCMVWAAATNTDRARMMNTGFWAYRGYMPVRWLLKNLGRRVRYAVVQRLAAIDRRLQQRGWRP